VPGAFDASPEPEFDLDEFRTAEEIQRNGEGLLQWLATAAESATLPRSTVTSFSTCTADGSKRPFPADAGRFRTSLVLNRKGTAVAVEGILPAVTSACSNWTYRRAAAPDIHPFLDGNTRTTWHLRNYLLMHDGLRPLIDLNDQSE
jgi:hypothetical protein